MAKTKTTPRKSDMKGRLPRQQMGESIAGTAVKTSYKDPLPPPSRTGSSFGNPSYLGKDMYLLNVRGVKIHCTECNTFYGTHVKGVESINKYMYLLKE